MIASRAIGRGSNVFVDASRFSFLVRALSTRATIAYSSPPPSPLSSSRILAPYRPRQSAPDPPLSIRHASSSSSSAAAPDLSQTPLYDLHLSHGAKMVPFGGFHMPVSYASLSLPASHAFTRAHASLFDVSHMAQRLFTGPGAASFLERITPSHVAGLAPGRSSLSALLHPSGGIVDDCVIARLPPGGGALFGPDIKGDADTEPVFYMVTNAACRDKDNAYLAEQLRAWRESGGAAVAHRLLDGQGLVALQGPDAAAVLEGSLVGEPSFGSLKELLFGQTGYARVRLADGAASGEVLVSRGGYTGEDGFEISVPGAETVAVTEALLAVGGPERVQLAGLGARDSLRLEAGMCLYGHDLDDSTTPVEAGLGWIVAKERRGEEAGRSFLGAETVLGQLVPKSKGGAGVERRRVGLVVEGAPAREGAEIVDRESGEKVGSVTSGCPSPTLGKNIAMGYVKEGLHKAGTEVDVLVRGKRRKATVTKMPFVPTKYWKGDA